MTAYDRKHRLEGGGGKVVLYVGDDDYPLPIPLVPDGPRWFWDTDAGDDEILYRRVGRNELATIQVSLAYVDAQREYYSRDRGAGMLEFAQRLGEHPGQTGRSLLADTARRESRARSARSSRRRGRRDTRDPSPASGRPTTATCFACCSRRVPPRLAALYDFVVKGT